MWRSLTSLLALASVRQRQRVVAHDADGREANAHAHAPVVAVAEQDEALDDVVATNGVGVAFHPAPG